MPRQIEEREADMWVSQRREKDMRKSQRREADVMNAPSFRPGVMPTYRDNNRDRAGENPRNPPVCWIIIGLTLASDG
jgi:hypothetical protein